MKYNSNSITNLGWLVLICFFLLKKTFSSNDPTAQTCIGATENMKNCQKTHKLTVYLLKKQKKK